MLPLFLEGKVTQYTGNGRKLGYPTANLKLETSLGDGVYFGFAGLAEHVGQPAIIFIGVPTTVGDTDRRLEAYLLDIADQDYYGQTMRVQVCQFHRPNQKFDSVEELLKAIAADEAAARAWFDNHPAA